MLQPMAGIYQQYAQKKDKPIVMKEEEKPKLVEKSAQKVVEDKK